MDVIQSYPDNMTEFSNDTYSDDSNYDNYNYDNYSIEMLCETSWNQKVSIKVAQMCIFSVVFLLGLAGNLLVITTFTLYRRLRLRCMTDVFLLHLAICDLLLLLTLPLQAGDTLMDHWEFGRALCKATRGIYAANTYGGLLLLACISVDRYVVIVQTRSARKLCRQKLLYSKLVVLAVWLASALLSLPEIIFANANEKDRLPQCEIEWNPSVKMATRITHIAGFCLPFLVMLVCYSLIGHTLLQGQGWRRQRTLRLILLLVLVFVVFQLPYTVVLSLKVVAPPTTCSQWNASLLAEYTTRSLAYTRCCLNPLLYALVGVRFRHDVIRLLGKMGCLNAAVCGSTASTLSDSCNSTTPTSLQPSSRSFFASTGAPLLSPEKPNITPELHLQPTASAHPVLPIWCNGVQSFPKPPY